MQPGLVASPNVNGVRVFFVLFSMRSVLGWLVMRVAEFLDRSLITVPEIDDNVCVAGFLEQAV